MSQLRTEIFPLRADDVESLVHLRTMSVGLVIISAVIVGTLVAFEAARSITTGGYLLGTIGALAVVFALERRAAGRRRIELTESDVRMKSFGMLRVCLWEDVADVRAAPLREVAGLAKLLLLWLLTVDSRKSVVVIELKRGLRQLPGQTTERTRGLGVPTAKRLFVEPVDTEGFLEASRPLVQRAANERRWRESPFA